VNLLPAENLIREEIYQVPESTAIGQLVGFLWWRYLAGFNKFLV